jgi:hypothetical protein
MSLVIVPRATRVNVWILRWSPPRPAVEADLFADGEAHDPDETPKIRPKVITMGNSQKRILGVTEAPYVAVTGVSESL